MKNLCDNYIMWCKKIFRIAQAHLRGQNTYEYICMCDCVFRQAGIHLCVEARGQPVASLFCRYYPEYYFWDWSLPIRLCCLMSKPQGPSCCWDSRVHAPITGIFTWVLKLKYSCLWDRHLTDSAVFPALKLLFKNTIIFEDKKWCYLSWLLYKPYVEQ